MASSSHDRRGGRLPGIINYEEIIYSGKEYIIGSVLHNNEDIHFIFDKDDYEKISKRAWHLSSGKYIASTIYIDGVKKELYLHNLVMNRLDFPGKGATESVDHINRNGLDNRKENLRILSQTEQNLHQSKKQRNVILPVGCGIQPEDIPRHIWYVRPNGLHGPRFAIEFKTKDFVWKGTSSKAVSLQTKLQQAKEKLIECYSKYPELDPSREDNLVAELNASFQAILEKVSIHS